MATQNVIDKDTQNIIKKYTLLYKAIFQYSIYFIPLILGIVRAWTLQSSQVIARTSIPTETKAKSFSLINDIFKAARISDDVWEILSWKWNVKILWGELQATWSILIWRNNLISFGIKENGIILPNRPYIIDMNFSWGLSYFTNSTYSVEQLKRVIDNRIISLAPSDSKYASGVNSSAIDAMFFRSKDRVNLTPTNMEQVLKVLQERMYFEPSKKLQQASAEAASITKNIFVKDENLECMFWWKVIDAFCNVNVNTFIKKIPELDLDQWRQDLLKISEKLQDDTQIDAFCSNLMINVLRKPYPTFELDQIMRNTCRPYEKRYERLKTFLWVQNEIESIVSEWVIPWDLEINLFKLVSLQQKIYAQHKDKLLDTNVITSYLRFLGALINDKSLTIPQFYIEESYYYNNIYLKNMLKKLTIESVNPTVHDDVSKLYDLISNINKWNPTVWVAGLEPLVINNNLKQENSLSTGLSILTLWNFEQAFTDMLKQYTDIRISKVETDETSRNARIIGNIRVIKPGEWSEENETVVISIIANFEYINWRFVIRSLRTPNDANTDTIVQDYITKNKKVDFGDIIYLVSNNLDIKNMTLSICNSLNNSLVIDKVSLISCYPNQAIIKIAWETLTLDIKDDIVIKWTISNPKRQKNIDTFINNQSINADRIIWTLEIIAWNISKEQETAEELSWSISATQLNIISKIEKFFGDTPTGIQQKNGKWIVEFKLKNYEFAAVIDPDNNYKLSPLVINAKWTFITINKFSLTLIPFSQERIIEFVDDPLQFIKSIDSVKYNEIIQVLWEKKDE